jgi:hypothetical protein
MSGDEINAYTQAPIDNFTVFIDPELQNLSLPCTIDPSQLAKPPDSSPTQLLFVPPVAMDQPDGMVSILVLPVDEPCAKFMSLPQ